MPKSSSYSFNSYGNSRSSASASAAAAAKSVYQQQPRIVQTTTAKSYTSTTPAPVPTNQAGSVYYTTEAVSHPFFLPLFFIFQHENRKMINRLIISFETDLLFNRGPSLLCRTHLLQHRAARVLLLLRRRQ